MQLGSKPFRFEKMWASDGECEEVIANAWLEGALVVGKIERVVRI